MLIYRVVLCILLCELGHDAIHTLDLPDGNRTPDSEISRVSVSEERIVTTKDSDFVNSLLISSVPFNCLSSRLAYSKR